MIRGRARAAGARARGDRGAAALEFALLVPMLLMIIFATIAFGLSLWIQISAAGTGRQAARLAAVGPDSCQAWNVDVGRSASFVYNDLSLEIADTNGSGVSDAGDEITVQFDYEANEAINNLLGLATGFFGDGVQLPTEYTEIERTRAERVITPSCDNLTNAP
jgi:Flp pilus assembly protein TadG